MTPELKTACEVVFQEHKVSAQPVKWTGETFRGRISLALSDLAKETLLRKNIIILPNKAKKIITQLNPVVAAANSFQEADDIITNNKQVLTGDINAKPALSVPPALPQLKEAQPRYVHRVIHVADSVESAVIETKWYLKPLFYYFIWPLCAVFAGAAIAFLLDRLYSQLFLP